MIAGRQPFLVGGGRLEQKMGKVSCDGSVGSTVQVLVLVLVPMLTMTAR